MIKQLPPLASSVADAKSQIRRFQDEVKAHPGLADLMGSFQAWYAIPDAEHGVILAPSKFVGYRNLSGQDYLQINRSTDGRDTEAVLRRWFSQPDTASEQLLIEELATFLNKFGKKPNKRARVSTISGLALTPGQDVEETPEGVAPLDAMMTFYRMLSADDQREFRRRLAR